MKRTLLIFLAVGVLLLAVGAGVYHEQVFGVMRERLS